MVTTPHDVHTLPAGTRVFGHLLRHGTSVDALAITGDEAWLPDGAYDTLLARLADLDEFVSVADDRAIGAWLARHDGPVDQRERLAAVSIAHHRRTSTAVGIKPRLAPLQAPPKRILLPIELATVRAAALFKPTRAALIGAIEAGLTQVEIVGLLGDDVLDDGAALRTRGSSRTRPRTVPVPAWAQPSLLACRDNGFGLLYNGTRPSLKDQTASIGMALKAVLQAAGVGFDPTVTGQSITHTAMHQLLSSQGIAAVAQRLGRTSYDAIIRRLDNATWA